MISSVRFREIGVTDLNAVSRFVLDICARELFPQFEDTGQDTLRRIYGVDSLRSQLWAGGAGVLAELDGQIAGAIALRPPAHIYLLYVDAPHRRLGLGAALMQRLLVLRPTAKRFTLNANIDAVAFYRSIGFQDEGVEEEADGLRFLPMFLEQNPSRGGNGP